MNCGFLLRIAICFCLSSTPRDVRRVDAFRAAKALAVTNSPRQKFFGKEHPKRLFGGRRGAQNERIGAPIRFCGIVGSRFGCRVAPARGGFSARFDRAHHLRGEASRRQRR
jgi:hypothetical protein